MAGFREFVTGEVLTAANVDDFLAKQAVMKFADASARDSALGTAVGGGNALREGMVAYLDDEDLPSFYNGTAWTTEFGGGGLVAVKHAIKTDTQVSSSVSGGSNVAVTGLSITHALADANNKLIISAYFGVVGHSEGQGQTGLAVADDGTLIGVGATVGSRTSVAAGGRTVQGDFATSITNIMSQTFVYEPGDTSSHTYTVRAVNISSSSASLYINRNVSDTDVAANPRAASALVVQEVAV